MKHRFLVLVAFFFACSDNTGTDGGTDAAGTDTGVTVDSGKDSTTSDTGVQDTGAQDTGIDTGIKDSGTDSGPKTDAGAPDAAPDAQDAGPMDAGFSLNGCTDNSFVDLSNQSRQRDWDLAQNFPYCFIITQGQSFTWNTTMNLTFANHPLEPAGGDQNNPIQTTNSGTTVSFTFNNVGNYGFDCQFHPQTMRGVIRVKQ